MPAQLRRELSNFALLHIFTVRKWPVERVARHLATIKTFPFPGGSKETIDKQLRRLLGIAHPPVKPRFAPLRDLMKEAAEVYREMQAEQPRGRPKRKKPA